MSSNAISARRAAGGGNHTPSAGAGRGTRSLVGLYLSSPLLAGLAAVILVPELIAFGLSLTNNTAGLPTKFVGLHNYSTILTDPSFWNSTEKTAIFVVGGVLAQVVIGLAISLFIARCVRRSAVLIAVALVPTAVSPAVLGIVWKFLFDQDAGPINYLLTLVGIHRISWLAEAGPAMIAVLVSYIWYTVPQVIILLYPAVAAVPNEQFEAARIDGAGRLRTLANVVLPWIWPAMAVALVFRTIIALRAFGEVFVLTQGGPQDATNIFGIYLYQLGFQQFQWGTASALGWIMLILTLAVAAVPMRGLARRMLKPEERQ